MKVALVHDWLSGMRGGEHVLAAFIRMYPTADVYTLVHVPGSVTPEIEARVVQQSFLGKCNWLGRHYRSLLPLFPFAASSLKINGYDLVISLSHAAAKNVSVDSRTRHVCYCFTPMRYIWDQVDEYLGALKYPLWPLIAALRQWDLKGAEGVSEFAAISQFVAARIRKFYGRKATVIHPPVAAGRFGIKNTGNSLPAGEAFLYAGALVPYKRPDVVVDAFNQLKLPLWVVGSGSMLSQLKRKAGPHITFFENVDDAELGQRLLRCRALVFPGTEDFGLLPIECMSVGRPVIALDRGGARESVIGRRWWSKEHDLPPEVETGVFIPRRGDITEAVIESVQYFCEHEQEFDPAACRSRAAAFSESHFAKAWSAFIG